MEHKIQHQKQFRYFTAGNVHSSNLLIVLHGYGQLPDYFIRKFTSLKNDYYIVAPEGMHRFYLNGSSGRVGASWMTKEAREDDIRDNISFLNKLFKNLTEENHYDTISILGFSQGGATASRWFYQLNKKNIQLILWASIFPPDLQISESVQMSQTKKNHFVLGTKDQFFNDEEQMKTIAFYKDLHYNIHTFDGNHDINQEILLKLFN